MVCSDISLKTEPNSLLNVTDRIGTSLVSSLNDFLYGLKMLVSYACVRDRFCASESQNIVDITCDFVIYVNNIGRNERGFPSSGIYNVNYANGIYASHTQP